MKSDAFSCEDTLYHFAALQTGETDPATAADDGEAARERQRGGDALPVRRVGLPVAYSQGFSPHPKLHFGLALAQGTGGNLGSRHGSATLILERE